MQNVNTKKLIINILIVIICSLLVRGCGKAILNGLEKINYVEDTGSVVSYEIDKDDEKYAFLKNSDFSDTCKISFPGASDQDAVLLKDDKISSYYYTDLVYRGLSELHLKVNVLSAYYCRIEEYNLLVANLSGDPAIDSIYVVFEQNEKDTGTEIRYQQVLKKSDIGDEGILRILRELPSRSKKAVWMKNDKIKID